MAMLSRQSVILELDGRVVRAALATPGRGGDAPTFERFDLPETLDLDDAAAVGATLGERLAELKISAARVVFIAPRGRAVLLDLRLPGEVDENELPAMVRFQAEKELPFAADNAVMDFRRSARPGEVDEPTTAVTVYAVQTATLDYYRTIAEAAGLRRAALTLRPAALAAYVARAVQSEPGECVAVVFAAAAELEIDFIVDGEAVFSRSARLAADGPEARAERVVREYRMSCQALGVSRPDLTPAGVLAAGEPAVAEAVCRQLRVHVEGECSVFRGAVPREAAVLDASWPAVLGASLAATGPEGELPDLMNPRRSVDRQAVRRRQVSLGIMTLLLALMLAGWLGLSHLGQLQKDAQRVGKLRSAAEDKAKEVEKLRKRVRAVKDWSAGQVDWMRHLAFVSRLAPGPEQFYLAEVTTGAAARMKLAVRATDSQVIEAFAATLAGVDGYTVTTPRLSPSRRDPLGLGYVYDNDLQLDIDPKRRVDLSGEPPVRPSDDDSAAELPKRLGRGRRGR